MREYIFTLKSELLEKVIDNYIDYVSNPKHRWRQFTMPSTAGGGNVTYNNGEGIKEMPLRTRNSLIKAQTVETMTIPKPRYETAKAHIITIIDCLYSHSLRSENRLFYISSKKLKAISNNYVFIIMTLSKMGIIQRFKTSTNGLNDRINYRIIDYGQFHPTNSRNLLNAVVKKQIQKMLDDEDKSHKAELDKVVSATSTEFVERYNKSLAQLTIDKKSAIQYVEDKYPSEDDILQKASRIRTIAKLTCGIQNYKEIRAIDDNGRIYHIGTELQRDIKGFTNIMFSIDCKNSHPFLFSYLLLKYFIEGDVNICENFDNNLFHRVLSDIMAHLRDSSNAEYHYTFSNFACKSLENSKLSKSELAKLKKIYESLKKIPDDVWQYISDVSQGKIWDMFVEEFMEDRTTVKQNVFASVMYSYPTMRKKKTQENKANKKWRDMFAKLYPTVNDAIEKIKVSLHRQCKDSGRIVKRKTPQTIMIGNHSVTYTHKDEVMLPLLLMRLESKIFTKILRSLFNKRVKCFGIHDAVAVLKSKLSEEEIQKIMLAAYHEYGLIPTLSIDYYPANG